MKYFTITIIFLLSTLLLIQSTSATIIPGAEVSGTITVNNNNGQISSNINNPDNSISVLFKEPLSSDSGGGGGGAFVEQNPTVSHTYVGGLKANKTYNNAIYNDKIFILNISFMLNTNIDSDVEIRVSQIISIDREPVPAMSNNKVVLNYGAIFYSGILNSYFKEANVVFQVYKDVLKMNGASKYDVKLYRYFEGNWVELDTRLIKETDKRFIYKAQTPGFSYFAVAVPNKNLSEEDKEYKYNTNNNSITGEVINNKNNNQESSKNNKNNVENEEKNEKSSSKRNNVFPLIIVIIIGGMLGAYIYISQQQEKGKFSEDQGLITSVDEINKNKPELFGTANIDESVFKRPEEQLHDYVEEELRDGFTREQIINELLKAGWDQTIIAKVIDKFKTSFLEKNNVHIPNEDFINLKNFIERKLSKGYSKEVIKENLLRVGWQEPIINSIIFDISNSDVKKKEGYSNEAEAKLDDFIRKAFHRGHSKEEITNKLLKVGWPKNIIDKVMKKY